VLYSRNKNGLNKQYKTFESQTKICTTRHGSMYEHVIVDENLLFSFTLCKLYLGSTLLLLLFLKHELDYYYYYYYYHVVSCIGFIQQTIFAYYVHCPTVVVCSFVIVLSGAPRLDTEFICDKLAL
jgi:hypothetical protein